MSSPIGYQNSQPFESSYKVSDTWLKASITAVASDGSIDVKYADLE